jgi:uncharacterized protein YbbC (DUF1343 family)
MLTGIDVLKSQQFAPLQGRRVGLLSNTGAVDADLRLTLDVLRANTHLVALFSPEHGFASTATDGEAVRSSVDLRTGLPVYSLYGDTCRPTSEMLRDIDVLVCDIQDVGARYYTYVWTISYILEAAGENGVEVVILDRPNPHGGLVVRGAPLDPKFASFVGRYNIPIQHGMTLGELTQMFNALWTNTPAAVTVIPCKVWWRSMTWNMTGLPFITPSPAMPHYSTAQHYPGACLLEGTTLSEGRGTALPFEVAGAPYIDPFMLAEQLNRTAVGVRYRPHTFKPFAGKYAGEVCYGVQAHITDTAAFDPIGAWLRVIHTVRHSYPKQFEWKTAHFDRLIGSDLPRRQIDAGVPVDDITAHWRDFCNEFKAMRQPYLLYH